MKTVLMAIAVVIKEDKVLLRQIDPKKNPYNEPWALFGGRIDGSGTVQDMLNKELNERWNFSITIDNRLWWDEEIKVDHDGIEKRFVYIDAVCSLSDNNPKPINQYEKLVWVEKNDLTNYKLNPPSKKIFVKLGWI